MENLELFSSEFTDTTTFNLSINELVSQLVRAESAYYNGTSIMDDAEYDRLRDELVARQPNHPHLAKIGAPLESASLLDKRTHAIPMGSQRKAMNRSDFDDWLRSISRDLKMPIGSLVFHNSYKLDGGSFSFQFRDGQMVECLSRGDGFVGESITENANHFQGIPNNVLHPTTQKPFSGYVRAEVVLHSEDWKAIDELQTSNPRNVGNGITRRKSGVNADKLRVRAFRAFNMDGTELTDTEWEMSRRLEAMGFEVAPDMKGSAEDVWEFFRGVDKKRQDAELSLPYWIDGMVVKLDSIAQQRQLGDSDNRPKGQIALKFSATGTPSVLEDIEVSVGHTGLLAPTGIFRPVQISGTTISRALLVNWDHIAELDIAIGDKVELYKAGEIIPKVLRVTDRPESRIPIEVPSKCPVCGGQVGKKQNVGGDESMHYFCLNEECSAKSVGKILRFIKSLNILGIGEEVLNAMIQQGLVSGVADLYGLHERKADLSNLELGSSGVRFGEKRAERVLSEIDKVRELNISQLLGSLGINHLGKRRVELMQQAVNGQLDSLQAWFDGTLIKVAEEAGVPKIAQSIQESLLATKASIDAIIGNGVKLVVHEQTEVSAMAFSVCATGKLSIPKKALEDQVKASGNIWKTSVGKGLTYLVMADPNSNSTKAQKARKLGVQCISEGDLLKKLG